MKDSPRTKSRLRAVQLGAAATALLGAVSLLRSHSLAEDAKPSAALRPAASGQRAAVSAPARVLTLAGARIALNAAVKEAERRGVGVAISVVDAGGHLLAAERLDGTFAAGAHVSEGKARTAVAFRRPTAFFEKVIREGRTPMIALGDGFTPLQGGVPIELDGQILGGVGASGASSAAEDEQLAMIAANAVLRALGAPLLSVAGNER
jgi:glc operon protein GlcG